MSGRVCRGVWSQPDGPLCLCAREFPRCSSPRFDRREGRFPLARRPGAARFLRHRLRVLRSLGRRLDRDRSVLGPPDRSPNYVRRHRSLTHGARLRAPYRGPALRSSGTRESEIRERCRYRQPARITVREDRTERPSATSTEAVSIPLSSIETATPRRIGRCRSQVRLLTSCPASRAFSLSSPDRPGVTVRERVTVSVGSNEPVVADYISPPFLTIYTVERDFGVVSPY